MFTCHKYRLCRGTSIHDHICLACEASGDADAGEQGLEVIEPDVRARRRAVLPVAAPSWHCRCAVNIYVRSSR